MSDIYLSYSKPNVEFAQSLKKDIECCSSLSVALEDDDWEENDGCGFQEHIHRAKVFIIIATEHSNITAWIIDHSKENEGWKHKVMRPPTVDFTHGYDDGFYVLKYILRVVAGKHRFPKTSSRRHLEAKKQKQHAATQKQSVDSSASNDVAKEDQSAEAMQEDKAESVEPVAAQSEKENESSSNDNEQSMKVDEPASPQSPKEAESEPKSDDKDSSQSATRTQSSSHQPRQSNFLDFVITNFQRMMDRMQGLDEVAQQ